MIQKASEEGFSGVWVPIITPFVLHSREEELDLEALAAMVEWLLAKRINGILVLGTTGEFPHLSDDESEKTVSKTVEVVAGRVPVLAGSGRASTAETKRMGKLFAAAGAQGILVLSPYYYRSQTSEENLRRFYFDVADVSEVPIFVYHIPQITKVWLGHDLLVELLQHENIWGFKDSSADNGPLCETLRRIRTQAFVGHGARIVEAFEAGASGAILAIAHLVPELCVALREAWVEGDVRRVDRLQEQARHLTHVLHGSAIAGIKAGLQVRGCNVGAPRAPIDELTPERLQILRHAVETALQVVDS